MNRQEELEDARIEALGDEMEDAEETVAMMREDEPEITSTPNGVFAGTVIGIRAMAVVDGTTFVAFGPDDSTAKQRLCSRLAAYWITKSKLEEGQ